MHKLLFHRYQGEVKLYSKNALFTILYIVYMVYLEKKKDKEKALLLILQIFKVKCRATVLFLFFSVFVSQNPNVTRSL